MFNQGWIPFIVQALRQRFAGLSEGKVPTAQLGSGTADANTFLAGDRAYKPVTWDSVEGKPVFSWDLLEGKPDLLPRHYVTADSPTVLVAFTRYWIAGSITVTLPFEPTGGKWVDVVALGTVSVARNGQTILGLEEDLTLDVENEAVRLLFIENTWKVLSLGRSLYVVE
jgi:hypothetical protein